MILKIFIYNSTNITIDELLDSKYLTTDDKTSFEKYKNLDVKKEKVISTILKNKYIGKYYLNEFGKPVSDDIYFNISHSHGYVVFVMDDAPVGIDIEKISHAEQDLIDYVSNDEEKKYIHDDQSFYEIWTNKEALVKAVGTGIKTNLKNINGLPINGNRLFEGKIYCNKTIMYDNYILTVSRQKDEHYDLEVVEEDL